MDYYRQCKLVNQNRYQISWIPECYAKPDKILRLKENDTWENGWRVESVGSFRIPESQLPYSDKAIRNHRSQTGDSLPKKS